VEYVSGRGETCDADTVFLLNPIVKGILRYLGVDKMIILK
jgi:hypothetical protein